MRTKMNIDGFKNLIIDNGYCTNELIPYPHLLNNCRKPIGMSIFINDKKFDIYLGDLEEKGYIDIPEDLNYLPTLKLSAGGSTESGVTYDKYDIEVEGFVKGDINCITLDIWWETPDGEEFEGYILDTNYWETYEWNQYGEITDKEMRDKEKYMEELGFMYSWESWRNDNYYPEDNDGQEVYEYEFTIHNRKDDRTFLKLLQSFEIGESVVYKNSLGCTSYLNDVIEDIQGYLDKEGKNE